jgi:hypothetical protein
VNDLNRLALAESAVIEALRAHETGRAGGRLRLVTDPERAEVWGVLTGSRGGVVFAHVVIDAAARGTEPTVIMRLPGDSHSLEAAISSALVAARAIEARSAVQTVAHAPEPRGCSASKGLSRGDRRARTRGSRHE